MPPIKQQAHKKCNLYAFKQFKELENWFKRLESAFVVTRQIKGEFVVF